MITRAKQVPAMPAMTPALEPAMLEAEPKPLEIDLKRTAVIVVDMQNAFVSKGGMFDVMGIDTSLSQKAIKPIKEITSAARAKGVKVIYLTQRYSPDLRDSGGPNSPNWYKELGIVGYREQPEWRDKFTTRGTWGADIVDEVKPREGDIIVEKQRYSGFVGTHLDVILKTFNIKYLAITGVATNICVEATLRDAYYLEYFPILVSEATGASGPPFMQESTEFNVKQCYGWVTTTENIVKAMKLKLS